MSDNFSSDPLIGIHQSLAMLVACMRTHRQFILDGAGAAGSPERRIAAERYKALYAQFLQQYLESVERDSPGLAARLDYRDLDVSFS